MAPQVTAAPHGLDVWIDVETPEQIEFSYSIAGIGSRGAAAALDAIICVASLIVLAVVAAFAVGFLGTKGKLEMMPPSASWIFAAYVIVQFVVIWGYYVLFEGLWDGQTPGKRVMQLRVVRDGGYSVSFEASAVRNLLRVVDAMPIPLYLIGIVAAMLNRSRKRIGDLVAGTIVIKEGRAEPRVEAKPDHTPAKASRTRAAAMSTAGQAAALAALKAPTALLSDDEYAVLELYVLRRQTLDPDRRRTLATQLAERFAKYLRTSSGASAAAGLPLLYEQERNARATGVAGRSDTGAKREQHAIVALGLKRWNDFAATLDAANARGLKRMPPEDVSSLVAQYREITSDLARLQTATRGRNSDTLFFLGRIVAKGHNLLYGQRKNTLNGIARYFTRAVPREVRRSWRQIALAAALLFGPAAVAYTAVLRDASVAAQLLPDEMLSRAGTAAERERKGEGYVTIDEAVRPIAASAIISNNVQITYMAFALGLTAGIGTVLLLVFNGVSIGSGVGVFAVNGVARVILAFIAPHGILELSAICIAGGGGFLIAQGMLLPGELARRDALIANGRRAINLIAASTLLLLVAGSIEGLVSPRVWPIAWKTAVSGATALALIGYLSLGRDQDRRADAMSSTTSGTTGGTKVSIAP
ncbi:MAG: stage II sporulation protein M [Gemmatimonadaceae bacterium]